jgi:hypothetical protein
MTMMINDAPGLAAILLNSASQWWGYFTATFHRPAPRATPIAALAPRAGQKKVRSGKRVEQRRSTHDDLKVKVMIAFTKSRSIDQAKS